MYILDTWQVTNAVTNLTETNLAETPQKRDEQMITNLTTNDKSILDGAKAFIKDSCDLPVGTTEVDITVRITGSVTKGDSYTQNIWQAAKPEQILRLLAAYSPLMREVIEKAVAEGEIATRLAALSDERDETVDAFITACRAEANRECAGKTTFKSLSVAEVSLADSANLKAIKVA